MIIQVYKDRRTPVGRREKIEGGLATGWRTVPDGFIAGDLVVEIDIEAIVHTMGAKALKSSGKKCVSGFVKVKAKNTRKMT